MLKAIIDNLESVPEAVRGEYRPGTADDGQEGKFVLQVEGSNGWGLEDVSGLKNALGRERTRADKAESKIKKFGDLDPEAAREAIEKIAEFQAIDPKKEGDRIAKEKIDAAIKQIVEKHSVELDGLNKKAGGYLGKVKALLIDNVATTALAEHKGSVDLLLPHVQRNTRLKETDDGNFVVEVVDKDGNVRIGDSKGTPMTVQQLVAEMRQSQTFGRAFEGSGTSGGGTQPSNGGGTATTPPAGIPKSFADAKSPEEKVAFLKHQNAQRAAKGAA